MMFASELNLVSLEFWASLLTLTALEIILGIDNLVFLSIATSNLPKAKQGLGRRLGLGLALFSRIGLLASAVAMTHLQNTILIISKFEFSWRDLMFFMGGLFLIWKSTAEIHELFQKSKTDKNIRKQHSRMSAVLIQIVVIDIVFSLDSVMTAVGMTQNFIVMALAILVSVALMIKASDFFNNLIEQYQSIKVLALNFVLMIGMLLIAEAFHLHVPREYLYAAMGFSLSCETINILLTKR